MLYLEIFDKTYKDKVPISGIVNPRDINYLKRLYTYNIDSIVNYYSNRNFAVKNTHILSRLLEHFPSHLSYNVYRYLELSEDKTKYLAKHFKFTSEIEKGIVHPSYFFGNEGEEILISSYDPFNPVEIETNWKTASCISVLRHNRNDTRLLLPLGNDDNSRSGLSIISVNIPKLSIKFREFLREQSLNEHTGEGLVLNKNHFVIKYVLPTMMKDIVDHTFLNKVMDRFYNREEVVPKFKHRFKIFEPTTQIDRYVENTLDVISNKRLDFINILRNIQLMFNKDASDLLSFENISATRQLKWGIFLSRLDHLIFLYDVSRYKDGTNRHYINDWVKLSKRILRDKGILGSFSYEMNKEIEEKIYTLTQY